MDTAKSDQIKKGVIRYFKPFLIWGLIILVVVAVILPSCQLPCVSLDGVRPSQFTMVSFYDKQDWRASPDAILKATPVVIFNRHEASEMFASSSYYIGGFFWSGPEHFGGAVLSDGSTRFIHILRYGPGFYIVGQSGYWIMSVNGQQIFKERMQVAEYQWEKQKTTTQP